MLGSGRKWTSRSPRCRGVRFGQQGVIGGPASRPRLPERLTQGWLITRVCPECPLQWGLFLAAPSALEFLASREIAARLEAPVSWGPAWALPFADLLLLEGGLRWELGVGLACSVTVDELCPQGRGFHSPAPRCTPSWQLKLLGPSPSASSQPARSAASGLCRQALGDGWALRAWGWPAWDCSPQAQ